MRVGNTKTSYQFNLMSNPIASVSVVSDLGVFIDDSANFSSYIHRIVTRASARANLIHKCFLSKDTSTLTRAFIVYVRPLLEYASVVWSPYLVKDILQGA